MKLYAYITNAGGLNKHGTDGLFCDTHPRFLEYRQKRQGRRQAAYDYVGCFDKIFCMAACVNWCRRYSTVAGTNLVLLKRQQRLRSDWSRK